MTRYIGALDQGTTSTRFLVFDLDGSIVSSAQTEHAQIFPQPGWVEHDPLEILDRTLETMGAALARADLGPGDLMAIGIANQRETTVLWDRRTGRPLAPAIVWQDTRVDPLAAELAREGGPDRFRGKTGLPLASYFSALKLKWLLDAIPDARRRAEAGDALFGTVDSWLVWNLTGGPQGGRHVTDVTNASRTQLMDLASCAWDDELLGAFTIPRACLPQIASSSEVYGEARASAVEGVSIGGILGDQQAALVGQACFGRGDAKNTYGTGCFLLMNAGGEPPRSRHGLLTTLAYRFGDEAPAYALEGSIANTGALVQWLRDGLRLFERADAIEALAGTVEDNGDVYIVPAFSGLYAPYWRPDARGIIAGLTRYAHRGHLARAALEAVAFQVCEVVDAMQADCGVSIGSLKVDGGMVVNELLMQIQADLLDAPVMRPNVHETTALGAAYAAALAVGGVDRPEALRARWRAERVWTPSLAPQRRARMRASWSKAVQRSLGWAG